MSNIYNCHAHVFNLDCAPLKFLDSYKGGAIARRALGLLQPIPWGIPLLVKTLNLLGGKRLPMLTRYAAFLDIGAGISQASVFEEQLLPNYAEGTRFVVLALNMDYMGAGAATLNYESQLWQLLEVRKRHPNTCLPFLCVDPRMGTAAANLEFVKKWIDRGFVGLKLYPSLGFFPFDERLDLVYEFAQANQLPVLTHCSRGGIYLQGDLPQQLLYPALPAYVSQEFQQNTGLAASLGLGSLPLKVDATSFYNDAFSDFMLDPRMYDLVLARYPELKLCLAHYGGSDEILKYLDKSAPPAAAGQPPTNWYEGVRWLMRKYPNVYTDLAFTLAEGPSVFDKAKRPKNELFKTLTADLSDEPYQNRLLFGTDFYLVSRLQPEKTLAGELMQYLLMQDTAEKKAAQTALNTALGNLAQQPGDATAQQAVVMAQERVARLVAPRTTAWQRLATDNPACFLHSAFYKPVERLPETNPYQVAYTPPPAGTSVPGLKPRPRFAAPVPATV